MKTGGSRRTLTYKDRERYIHQLRVKSGRVTWTVQKSPFGQNDILGCIDTISYSPTDIYLDQTTSVGNMSHRKKRIEEMMVNPPLISGIVITVHGIDGYRMRSGGKWIPVITKHIMEIWHGDGTWERRAVISKPKKRGGD